MSASVLSNLESVGDLVGSLMAISEGLEEDSYVENLILQAHGKAANAFDLSAAATASTGRITHMYEFGVAGITRGSPKFPDPTAPAARLWVHQIYGRGGQQDIAFTFRPALNRNPNPTTRDTGVASKYIKMLSRRKYIFTNKAFVMETGAVVEHKASADHLIFVPFYGKPASNPANNNSRGYIMTAKPFSSTPGKNTKGDFTKTWMTWWGSTGGEIMEKSMRANVNADLDIAMAEATKRANAHSPKPVQMTNLSQAASRSRAVVKKLFTKRKMVKTI